jgi:hypothetical protein
VPLAFAGRGAALGPGAASASAARPRPPGRAAIGAGSGDFSHPQPIPHPTSDRALSDLERDRWEDVLRGLTAERASIKAGMAFALDHAEAAAEVVEVLQVRVGRKRASRRGQEA